MLPVTVRYFIVTNISRSAIKKILERDDSSSRSMVLCVASLDETDFDANNESKSNSRSRNIEVGFNS